MALSCEINGPLILALEGLELNKIDDNTEERIKSTPPDPERAFARSCMQNDHFPDIFPTFSMFSRHFPDRGANKNTLNLQNS